MASKESRKPENNQVNSGYGGARKNAGRKPGAATTKTREIANKAIEAGISPLEYMLAVMRAPEIETDDIRLKIDQKAMRFEAAKAAAPYVHPRLNSVELAGKDGQPIETVNRIELVAASGNSKA